MFGSRLRITSSSFLVMFRGIALVNNATPEQVAMVKKAFDPLSLDAPRIGKVFFERLFELYPGSKKYFKHLGSTDEELFANPIFQRHCTKVILSVGSMIDNLYKNNHKSNEDLFEKLAAIHAKRKVSAQQTPYIKHTLMDVLHLEPHSIMEKAWINVIDTLFTEYNEKMEATESKVY